MAGAAAIAFASAPAMADHITIDESASAFGSNVVFNPCEGIATSGTTVQGCLNSSKTTIVNLQGTESLSVNGGQARVEATSGTFNSLTVSLADATLGFSTLVLNVNTAMRDVGDIFFTADLVDGADYMSDFFTLGNGQNFFTISVTGDLFRSITVASVMGDLAVEFQDIRQIRLAVEKISDGGGGGGGGGDPDPDETPIPEPAALGLFGLGLLGLGFRRRRTV